MQDFNPEKRVQKMVSAIKSEASDKAESIKENAKSQLNIERNRIFIQEKQKIQEEYRQKLENYSIKKRIERSARVNEQRLAKMRTRYELITKLKDEVRQQISQTFSADAGKYKKFLQLLIVEAMVKLMEPQVSLRCLDKDIKVIESILGDCESAFTKLVSEKCSGVQMNSKITINKNQTIDADGTKCLGGIILSCFDGKIVCSNTVDQRVELCFEEMLPDIRYGLFPESN